MQRCTIENQCYRAAYRKWDCHPSSMRTIAFCNVDSQSAMRKHTKANVLNPNKEEKKSSKRKRKHKRKGKTKIDTTISAQSNTFDTQSKYIQYLF